MSTVALKLPDGRLVNCRVNRNPRSTRLKLTIRPGGSVLLSAPRSARQADVEAFARSSATWIMQRLPELPQRPDELHLQALNERWLVDFDPRARRLSASDGTVTLGGTDLNGSNVSQLRDWLMKRARDHLPGQLATLSEATGLGYDRVTVRGQTTRWGSYSSRGTVSLNFKLLFLPDDLVRYVLLHELCHGVHLNHSPAYWELVARHQPGLESIRRRMRTAGRLVPAWLETPL